LNFIEDQEPESTLPPYLLEAYQGRVKERFRNLHKIVDAQPPGEGDAQRRGNASLTQGAQSQGSGGFPAYKVQWQDQDELALKFVWEERPSSIKVWITQEDLWVYETLLRIISNVNQNATGAHNASIKVISALKVGKDAIEGSDTQGRTFRIPVAGAQDIQAQTTAETPPVAQAEGAMEEMILKDRRYLDAEGKPLPAGQDGQSAEFKRVPVRMELVMEKLDLAELLVECANAPLPVEVRQVRINRGQISGGTRDWAPPAPGSSPNNQGTENVGWVESPSIGTVIVHGVIYIYNEPDLAALGFSEEEIAQRANQGQPAPADTSAG
jgi:hypothetical protein